LRDDDLEHPPAAAHATYSHVLCRYFVDFPGRDLSDDASARDIATSGGRAATDSRAGKLEHHASLDALLAIFRARIEAGETSALLALALADFGQEFKALITLDLGFRRA
jgi:hypothetical protein